MFESNLREIGNEIVKDFTSTVVYVFQYVLLDIRVSQKFCNIFYNVSNNLTALRSWRWQSTLNWKMFIQPLSATIWIHFYDFVYDIGIYGFF